MASVERTAYPRFKRVVSARELAEFFTPSLEETAWERSRTRSPEGLLALALWLKSCQRLGYFAALATVPAAVVDHVRARLGLGTEVMPSAGVRAGENYRTWIRECLGLVRDPARAREIAVAATEAAAPVKAHSADLVNVALEEIVRAGLELPGFSTLDRMAASVRARVEGRSARGSCPG
ncbi:DUF4158 domain-containing protein [Streptomyces sp. x-80]|uniref:DUF4158 domain-containing protein n=1 Tax=Streptomyces sp. x-80 TaxID=2789282 RepID=UPI003981524F